MNWEEKSFLKETLSPHAAYTTQQYLEQFHWFQSRARRESNSYVHRTTVTAQDSGFPL